MNVCVCVCVKFIQCKRRHDRISISINLQWELFEIHKMYMCHF